MVQWNIHGLFNLRGSKCSWRWWAKPWMHLSRNPNSYLMLKSVCLMRCRIRIPTMRRTLRFGVKFVRVTYWRYLVKVIIDYQRIPGNGLLHRISDLFEIMSITDEFSCYLLMSLEHQTHLNNVKTSVPTTQKILRHYYKDKWISAAQGKCQYVLWEPYKTHKWNLWVTRFSKRRQICYILNYAHIFQRRYFRLACLMGTGVHLCEIKSITLKL